MKIKIRDEDRRAMDILMDRNAMAPGNAHGLPLYASTDARLRERVSHVEKVLGLIGNMPASDPSQNLLARTLQFIETGGGKNAGEGERQSGLVSSQTHLA